MRAIVNDECIGCGMCIDICSEVFSYNDEEKSQAIKEEIPADLEEKVKEAAGACPVEAIKIDE